MEPIKFVSVNPIFHPTFWTKLYQLKLDKYKLDINEVDINVKYKSNKNGQVVVEFNSDSLEDNNDIRKRIKCKLYLYNTLNSFKTNVAKQNEDVVEDLWGDVQSGKMFEDHTSINKCVLSVYIDFKKYKFYHWFSCPVFKIPYQINIETSTKLPIIFPNQDERDLISDQINNYVFHHDKFMTVYLRNHDGIIVPLSDSLISEIDNYTLIVLDISTHPKYPSWFMRNLLFAIGYTIEDSIKLDIIYYRDNGYNIDNSILINTTLEPILTDDLEFKNYKPLYYAGFAKNSMGKFQPSVTDLSTSLSPDKMAKSALNLNTKLMKWKISPDLDLDTITDKTCLLIGSGTLGSHVARNLLGWGITQITFVDCGEVTHSNPVRQSLYLQSDVSKPKAKTAAENLKKIYGGVDVQSVDLKIPMPGHPITDMEKLKKDIERLEKIIVGHEVIFLLTDTRESRWLPTLMCKALCEQKLCFTAAIGFDSFVAMRHGNMDEEDGNMMACYFCSDILEPSDTLKDATMDKRCTVTRPGVSAIAAGYVTELMLACLGRQQKIKSDMTDLERIPQQIRGKLSDFSLMSSVVEQSELCNACSSTIQSHYQSDPMNFVLKILKDPTQLTEILDIKYDESDIYDWDFTYDGSTEVNQKIEDNTE